MTPLDHTLRAAKHYKAWGRPMAVAYLAKRGIPRRLLTIALQLSRTQAWV